MLKPIGKVESHKDVYLTDGELHVLKSECGTELAEVKVTDPTNVVSYWQAKTKDGKYITPLVKVQGAVYYGPKDNFDMFDIESYISQQGEVVNLIVLTYTGRAHD